MAKAVKPADLLLALGVVAEAEDDRKLAKRLTRLANKITSHLIGCERCQAARAVPALMRFALVPERTAFCADGLMLITALGRAAAANTRDGIEDRL